MKKNKMSLTTELDLTREGTAEMTRWCILYNAIARKEGRPELTYGYWAAAGKPARP